MKRIAVLIAAAMLATPVARADLPPAGKEIRKAPPQTSARRFRAPPITPLMLAEYPKGTEAFLKAELEITAQQEPAWKAYSALLSRLVEDDRRAERAAWNKSAPERMQLRINRIEEFLEIQRKRQAALQALYKVLSPAQRDKADTLLGF